MRFGRQTRSISRSKSGAPVRGRPARVLVVLDGRDVRAPTRKKGRIASALFVFRLLLKQTQLLGLSTWLKL